jgi:hypothetical protein
VGNKDEQIERLVRLYNDVETMMAKAASQVSRLEMTVLVLSILTSGSLWLLLGEAIPQPTLWLGAIASTIVTIITLYLNTSGVKKVRKQAIGLYQALGRFIAECRASTSGLSDEMYWGRLKEFEGWVAELRHRQFGDND